jgi:hypothetical protein
MNTQKQIKLGDDVYVIRKMPLRKYAAFLEVLDQLPEDVKKDIGAIDLTSNDEFLSSLPRLLAKAFPQMVKVLSVASDIPEDKLMDEYGLAEAALVIRAVFEVNDFLQVKNALVAAFQGIKQATATEQKTSTQADKKTG